MGESGKRQGIKPFLFGKISRKFYFILAVFTLSLLAIGLISVFEFNRIGDPFSEAVPESLEGIARTSKLDSLAQFIRYYDEVLTQCARNYAFTGDAKWVERYRETEPELDKAINEAIRLGDDGDKDFFSSVEEANLALVKLEQEAILLVSVGDRNSAVAILESDEYWGLKKNYETSLKQYVERRGRAYNETLSVSGDTVTELSNRTRQEIGFSTSLIIFLVIFALAAGVLLVLLVSRSILSPVFELEKQAEEIKMGNFGARSNIRSGDELQELGETMNRAAEALDRMDAEHKQLEHAKTEFLSITSHELRSPMTPMRAQLQMLLGGYFGKINKKQRESAEIVLRNTERLDRIILDFLEISRIEAARLKFRFIKTSLKPYIERLLVEMRGFMPEKKIKVEAKLGELPVMEVDPDRAMQVLRNLLNNAKKFSPKGSTIIVSAKQKDEMIQFSVKDRGIGISKEAQLRVFEPFYQAEQTMYREHGGTGLGLAICKGIVESQNGKLWIESEPGKGSTFSFTVPLKPVKEIKPIKLLFSQKEEIDEQIKRAFVEFLGPLGNNEFSIISEQGISQENVFKYIDLLKQEKVVTWEKTEEFKNKVKEIFGVPEESSSEAVEEFFALDKEKVKK